MREAARPSDRVASSKSDRSWSGDLRGGDPGSAGHADKDKRLRAVGRHADRVPDLSIAVWTDRDQAGRPGHDATTDHARLYLRDGQGGLRIGEDESVQHHLDLA